MARKLGLASRLVPRFGLLWTVAAMLLFISGAGWWKFHRDLYVEERQVVEALKASGAKVACHHQDFRFFAGSLEEEPTDVPWDAPFRPPILMILVQGDPAPSARNAALRLPQLKAYSDGSRIPMRAPPLKPDDWNGVERFLGRELPGLPEPTLDKAHLDGPLPKGEQVSDVEANRIGAEIYAAWQSPEAVPPRRLVVREASYTSASLPVPEKPFRVDVLEPTRAFRYSRDERHGGGESATLRLHGDTCWFTRVANLRWRRQSRRTNVDDPVELSLFRRFPDDEFPYVAADFNGSGSAGRWIRERSPRFEYQRIARIDDVRYRVDFLPFEIPMDPSLDIGFGLSPRIDEWNCVLRSDLGWTPEQSRLVQTTVYPGQPTIGCERRLVQRFRRDGKYVTLTERLSSERCGTTAAPGSPEVVYARYVTELDPERHDRTFDPLALDPEPWPQPRELPWLRWYRVTLVLGCALGLFLVGRRFVPRGASGNEVPTVPEDQLEP